MSDERAVLITGGAGFIGSNLADRLAGSGHNVLVFDSLARSGVEQNLAWLQQKHGRRIEPVVADVRNRAAVDAAVARAKVVFHFAAQVAVTTSLQDPREDFDINLLGTVNLLEALRSQAEPPPALFASTNKVYGALGDVALISTNAGYLPADPALRVHGVSEDCPSSFHTPYGCSKGAADQYVLDYGRSFGVPTAVLRMSCVYGRRQRGTEDQGWVAHFLLRMLRDDPVTIYGDGKQVRDVLWIDDALDAYVGAWERMGRVRGRAFNLGGGPANAVSLLAVIERIEHMLGRPARLSFEDWRPGDQRYFVADTRRAGAALGLAPPRDWRSGLALLTDWFATAPADLAEAAQ